MKLRDRIAIEAMKKLMPKKADTSKATDVAKCAVAYADALLAELGHGERLEAPPSWDSAPKWANWRAQDYNGKWHWFEYRPTLTIGFMTLEQRPATPCI